MMATLYLCLTFSLGEVKAEVLELILDLAELINGETVGRIAEGRFDAL